MFNQLIKELRRFRIIYWFLNLKNARLLNRNKSIYKKLKIDKPIHFSLQSKDVMHLPEQSLGIDNSDYLTKLIQNETVLNSIGLTATDVAFFADNGFLILNQFFSQSEVEDINLEIENKINSGEFNFNFTGRKIPFAFKKSDVLKRVTLNERLLKINECLIGQPVFAYHTLNFIQGSEQAPHSDAIHMSTYPQGGLIAAWIALESTDENNGPLVYFPGSHKMPYLKNSDLNLKENFLLLDENPNAKYERKIAEILAEHKMDSQEFHAAQGDVLIWHGNLVHGGKKMIDKDRTRKSMVIHYLREEALCWHELSQRPALVEKIS